MYEAQKLHPLLAQVPLTVSPFVSIPSAVTLPYTFKSVPTSLPPSMIADTNNEEKRQYIISARGHTAHPDDVIASCEALQNHLKRSSVDAERTIQKWEDGIKKRDLAEKRRVAPGWLDREEKILEPTKLRNKQIDPSSSIGIPKSQQRDKPPAAESSHEGEEIDRAFGQLAVK